MLNQSEPNVILTAHATKLNRPEPNWTKPQTCLAGRNHAFNWRRLKNDNSSTNSFLITPKLCHSLYHIICTMGMNIDFCPSCTNWSEYIKLWFSQPLCNDYCSICCVLISRPCLHFGVMISSVGWSCQVAFEPWLYVMDVTGFTAVLVYIHACASLPCTV